METIHPFLDEAIGEYALGAHNIFYIGVWFVANACCKDAANPRKLSFSHATFTVPPGSD